MKKNSKGLYETSRVINGKRVKFRSKSLRGLDAKIAAYTEKAAAGRDFPTVAWEWQEEHERCVATNTARIYNTSLNALTAHFTGPIRDIRPLDVQRYFSMRAGQGYAKHTLAIELNVLRQVCAFAVLAGDIDVSPVTEVKLPRGLPQKKRTALTAEQERMVAEYRGPHYLLGLFLLYTGMRRGELLALNWQDIDRAAGVIHVTKKLDGRLGRIDNHLKSENGRRDVPLFTPLANALGSMDRLGRVFPIDRDYQFSIVWKEFCDGVGLFDEITFDNGNTKRSYPITPHCFRHSFATVCYEAGCDARTTAAFLGDTVQTAEAVYVELRAAHHATGADRVNAYLELQEAEQARAE